MAINRVERLIEKFQHTAARRRLAICYLLILTRCEFQHTAARRRLVAHDNGFGADLSVSTHSRPKAAGRPRIPKPFKIICFNTQPPEGGWEDELLTYQRFFGFNTQPPEGGWGMFDKQYFIQ